MSKIYSRDELYSFVWRADTHEKIAVADKWLRSNFDKVYFGNESDLFDDLMMTLAYQSRELYRAGK